MQYSALALERDQRGQIQPILVNDGAARVAGADKHRPFLCEESRSVFAHRSEALDHDSRTGQLQLDMVSRCIDCAD